MEVPIVAPAPVVIPHAVVCRDLFDDHGPCRHFQHSLTGLIVLPKKSLAHRARGILDSADNTNVSCFRSGAPRRADMGNQRRIGCMLQETQPQRRQDGISLRKQNRWLEPASVHQREANGWTLTLPRPHLAVKALVPRIPATASRPITIRESKFWCVTLGLRIPGVGQGQIVSSCEPASLPGRSAVLVTHRVDGSAAQSIGFDLPRRPTATCYQDSKRQLGFNAYRMRSAEALEPHWCLVVVASALWPLTCLPAGPDRAKGLIHTMGDACRQQGRALLQKLWVGVHEQLSHGATADQVFAP